MEWISPYQQDDYNDALKELGVKVVKTPPLGTLPALYFNNLSSTNMVAWEADGVVDTPCKPEEDSDVWTFEGAYEYQDIKWDPENYYSLIVPRDSAFDTIYSSNNRRNIKKALQSGLLYSTTDTQIGLQEVFPLFETNKVFMGGVKFEIFRNLVEKLVEAGLAYVHTVGDGNQIMAAAISIHSPEVANIRYVASLTEYLKYRPVNLLYHSIINFYLRVGQNCKYVDLSGIIPPSSQDEKLLGITRFKREFSNLVVSFTKK